MLRNYRATSNNSANLIRGGGAKGELGNVLFKNKLYVMQGSSGNPLTDIIIEVPQEQYVKNALEILTQYAGPRHPNVSNYMSLVDISGTVRVKETIKIDSMYITLGNTTTPFSVTSYNAASVIYGTYLSDTRFIINDHSNTVRLTNINPYTGSEVQINEVCIYLNILITEGAIGTYRILYQRILLPETFTLNATYNYVQLRNTITIR